MRIEPNDTLDRLQRAALAVGAAGCWSSLTDERNEIVELVVKESRNKAPKLTHALADSIKGKSTKRQSYVKAGTRTRLPYAAPIHWGWAARNIESQPFFYEALEDTMGQITSKLRVGLVDKLLARKIVGL